LSGLPLLIFANKQDLSLSLNPEEIMDILNLNNIQDRKWTIVACSAVTKAGIQDGINWLLDNIK
jgi:signal recognition particle receptor subunit beta